MKYSSDDKISKKDIELIYKDEDNTIRLTSK
jgi:hypothetical protein